MRIARARELLSCLGFDTGVAMEALERLVAAHQAAREGRHQAALEAFMWFHDQALAEGPAARGAYLWAALREWVDLAKTYPPALQALQAMREQKARALLRGDGNRHQFHDVVAIDKRMERSHATHALYLALTERQPPLAAECTGMALPAIVAAGDYRLADQLRPDREARIRPRALGLARQMQWERRVCRFTKAPRRWAAIKNYADEVGLYLQIATGLGRHAEARRLQALAIDLIGAPVLRDAVRTELAKPSNGSFGFAGLWHRHRKAQRREARGRAA